MSYLYRTGNSRNNIAFTNTANSSTKYLRRTSTSRNSIVWTTIPQGSTYNILQRNGTGRNNIAWTNLKIAGPNDPITQSNISGTFTLLTVNGIINEIKISKSSHRIVPTTRWQEGTVFGTTLTNMRYHIASATVNPVDYYVDFSGVSAYPNNFETLWNRLYIYQDDNNYVIIPVSNVSIRHMSSTGNNFIEADYTQDSVITKYEGSFITGFTRLVKNWDAYDTPITVVYYHWV